MIIDNFLPARVFDELVEHARGLDYMGEVSPIDYVEYPDISTDVPCWFKYMFQAKLAALANTDLDEIEIHQQYFRLTTENTPLAPHGAHNDADHSEFSAFYYINPAPDDVIAGTSLLSHCVYEMPYGPESRQQMEAWEHDTNEYDAWDIDELFEWQENRMVIYRSDRMHRAEPPGGWGEDATDGRLVLITFFS